MKTFKQFITEVDINPKDLKNLNKAVNDNLIGDKLDAEILRQRKIKNKFKGKSTDKGV
tara:strand:- start:303 stop:476 length:174 start_codon:yes stop_codon:yes gene_type:complete